jgi:hypothetical protein
MSTILTAVVFGWPAMLASLLTAGIGLVWKRWPWLLAAALLVIPPAWLFSGYPSIRWSAFLLPIFLLVSAIAVRARKYSLAWLLVFPVAAAMAWLAILVLLQ